MADQDSTRLIAPGGRILPEEVANRSFKSALRGISETDVRVYLRRVADEIARMRSDEQALRTRIAELEERLRNPAPPSEQQLLDALGEETAKVLRSAQDAADEIRSKAEDRAAAVRREAQDEAKRVRESADADAAARVAELEREAVSIREAAEARALTMVAEAESRVQAVLDDAAREGDRIKQRAVDVAEAHLEDARTSGREMVAEANTLRERILTDLATRRGLLSEQIEELRAGRESLLGAYKVVKESLDAATAALRNVEARAAAELLGAGPDPASLSLANLAPASGSDGVLVEPAPVFYDQDAATANEVVAGPELDEAGLDLAAAEFAAAIARPSAEADETLEPTDLAAEVAELEAELEAETIALAETEVRSDVPEEPEAEVAGGVDALFAKLRAAREEAVDEARHVLEDADATSGSVEAAEGETEVVIDLAEDAPAADVAPETPIAVAVEAGSDDALRAAQHSAIEAVAPGLVRKAKRVLQDEQNEILDALRTAKRARKSQNVLPDRAARLEVWGSVLAPVVASVYAAGWESAGTDAPVPEQAPQTVVEELADGLVSPWRDRLAEAIDADDDTDPVTRVGARFRELRSQSLGAALREALAAAYARGVFDATPDGAVLRWVPSEVGRCPDCDDNALEPVLKGAPFPTGQVFPPAHPGCQCLLGTLTPAVGTATS